MTIRNYIMTAVALSFVSPAIAAPILWVSDSNGNIAKVDVATGLGTTIAYSGPVLTDIAFNGTGDLFGISFTTLYKINKDTGARTTVGALGGSAFNALVFSSTGTLYAAAGTSLYSVDTTTGLATSLGSTGFSSAGDLAFFGSKLYLSASGSGTSQLVDIGLAPVNGTLVGATGVNDVFGLARGDDGILYGVAGNSIYTMNVTTGAATLATSYNYAGRGAAFGSAFFAEATGAVPEPTTWAMMLMGFGIAGYSLRRRRFGSTQLA